jgi:hypothetical protein
MLNKINSFPIPMQHFMGNETSEPLYYFPEKDPILGMFSSEAACSGGSTNEILSSLLPIQ